MENAKGRERMTEPNLKQITDKLNTEFTGETRKLVFWYDEKAEFADEINDITLDHAKIYLLKQDNQFYTKFILSQMTMKRYLMKISMWQIRGMMTYRSLFLKNLRLTPEAGKQCFAAHCFTNAIQQGIL